MKEKKLFGQRVLKVKFERDEIVRSKNIKSNVK